MTTPERISLLAANIESAYDQASRALQLDREESARFMIGLAAEYARELLTLIRLTEPGMRPESV
jgi:hypothetical protein